MYSPNTQKNRKIMEIMVQSFKKLKRGIPIILCSTALLVAGCGGGDGSSTGPDTNPDPDTDTDTTNTNNGGDNNGGDDSGGDDNNNDTPQPVSFAQDITPIFSSSCAVSGCHDSGTQQSGVNLSSYDAVMNSMGNQYGEKVINPGNPDQSPLVDKIEADPEIPDRMPKGRAPLSQTKIDSIRAWIEDGAPNN